MEEEARLQRCVRVHCSGSPLVLVTVGKVKGTDLSMWCLRLWELAPQPGARGKRRTPVRERGSGKEDREAEADRGEVGKEKEEGGLERRRLEGGRGRSGRVDPSLMRLHFSLLLFLCVLQ